MGESCVGAKSSAAMELTCSHSLNSSAEASLLSDWGRWISPALHRTSLPRSSLPRSSPIPLLVFSARRGGRKEKKIEKRKVTVHIYYPARRFA